MKNIVLELPEDLCDALRLPPDETEKRLKQELAVRLYQKRILSFGKAHTLSGLSKWDFHNLLGREAVEKTYDLDEFETDRENLNKLP